MLRRSCARRGYGNEVEYDEEEDGSWNMDIGICCVDKSHYVWIPQKGTLEAEFVKDVQGLLEGYELKCMVPCKVDYSLIDPKGPNRTCNLIDLLWRFVSLRILVIRKQPFHGSVEGLWNSAYPVN